MSALLELRREKKLLLEKYLKEEMGVTIIPKNKSKFMKFLKFVLRWNETVWNNVSYTFGKNIYPGVCYEDIDTTINETKLAIYIAMLSHEAMHVYDEKRFSMPIYFFIYAFPQVLASLSLLSFFAIGGNLAWLWSLISLVFVAPLPSPRAYFEARGYTIEMAIDFRLRGKFSDIKHYASQFNSLLYYFMFPFEGHMAKHFTNKMLAIREKCLPVDFYVDLKKAMKI